MEIRIDDLTSDVVAALLEEHHGEMQEHSPRESIHALDLQGLRTPDVTFWSAWDDGVLVGCGALKELDSQHGEIKSMRVSYAYRGRGFGAKVLAHILKEAEARGYTRLSLETGSQDAFIPARKMYEQHGFSYCDPFAAYVLDPNSVFMTREM